jgi:hypothetical protein
MQAIDVGTAEMRVLKKVLSAASSGGHLRLNVKEQNMMSALYRRLTAFDETSEQ